MTKARKSPAAPPLLWPLKSPKAMCLNPVRGRALAKSPSTNTWPLSTTRRTSAWPCISLTGRADHALSEPEIHPHHRGDFPVWLRHGLVSVSDRREPYGQSASDCPCGADGGAVRYLDHYAGGRHSDHYRLCVGQACRTWVDHRMGADFADHLPVCGGSLAAGAGATE